MREKIIFIDSETLYVTTAEGRIILNPLVVEPLKETLALIHYDAKIILFSSQPGEINQPDHVTPCFTQGQTTLHTLRAAIEPRDEEIESRLQFEIASPMPIFSNIQNPVLIISSDPAFNEMTQHVVIDPSFTLLQGQLNPWHISSANKLIEQLKTTDYPRELLISLDVDETIVFQMNSRIEMLNFNVIYLLKNIIEQIDNFNQDKKPEEQIVLHLGFTTTRLRDEIEILKRAYDKKIIPDMRAFIEHMKMLLSGKNLDEIFGETRHHELQQSSVLLTNVIMDSFLHELRKMLPGKRLFISDRYQGYLGDIRLNAENNTIQHISLGHKVLYFMHLITQNPSLHILHIEDKESELIAFTAKNMQKIKQEIFHDNLDNLCNLENQLQAIQVFFTDPEELIKTMTKKMRDILPQPSMSKPTLFKSPKTVFRNLDELGKAPNFN